jgi:uncharacterized protein YqeY
MIIEDINQDLLTAQKAREEETLTCLRMLKSAIKYAAIQGKKDDLSDEEIMGVIQKQIKQRRDSIEAYNKANRPELAKKEEREAEVLSAYLPEGMSEEELKKVVQSVISSTGAQSKADMGKVMKEVMSKVSGRADGSQVSKLVNQLLS